MSTPFDQSSTPWDVAATQERQRRARQRYEAQQAEIEAARARPAPPDPRRPIEPDLDVMPESGFERAMREGIGGDPGVISLGGAEMIAYIRVKAASIAALAAQHAHQAAGVELREAIEAMCQIMAPPVK